MTLARRIALLEARQGQALSLWEHLPEHLRGEVTPEQLEQAAQDAPKHLRRDLPALALLAYLSIDDDQVEEDGGNGRPA